MKRNFSSIITLLDHKENGEKKKNFYILILMDILKVLNTLFMWFIPQCIV